MTEAPTLAVAVETPRLPSTVGGLLDYASERATCARHAGPRATGPARSCRASSGSAAADGGCRRRPDCAPWTAVLTPCRPRRRWRELVDFAAAYYQRGVGELALAVLPPELRKLDDDGSWRAAWRGWRPRRQHGPQAARRLVAAATDSSARAERRADGRAGTPSPTADAAGAAARRHRQRQDRGLPACRRNAALRSGPPGAGAGARDQPHAAARGALREALPGPHGMASPAQRPDAGAAPAPLAAGAPGTGRPRAGHAAGRLRVDAAARPDRRRRGARPLVQAAGGRTLLGARPGRLARARLEHVAGAAGLGDAVAGDLAARGRRPLPARWRWPSASAAARCPQVRLVDMHAAAARGAARARCSRRRCWRRSRERIERGEQSLLLLNRRGYAPVLHCGACGWKSGCPHCSAWRVFHKPDRTLRCHHCGLTERVPRACPECGNLDIAPHRPRHREARGAAGHRCCRVRASRASTPTARAAKGALRAQLGGRARGRGRRAGGHADGGQGARLPPRHAGGGGRTPMPRCSAATSAPPSACSRC